MAGKRFKTGKEDEKKFQQDYRNDYFSFRVNPYEEVIDDDVDLDAKYDEDLDEPDEKTKQKEFEEKFKKMQEKYCEKQRKCQAKPSFKKMLFGFFMVVLVLLLVVVGIFCFLDNGKLNKFNYKNIEKNCELIFKYMSNW